MLYFFYKFEDKPFQRSQIETWDDTIIKATPALAWAVGRKLSWFIPYSAARGYSWKLAKECERYPSLSAFHPKNTTDIALFDRVSP